MAVQLAPSTSHPSASEYDPGVADPSWKPPDSPSGPAAANRKPIPAGVFYGCILLVLVLLVVAVWGFGGFKRRTDLLKTMPPGALITSGPYEFRFTEATAQRKKKYDGTFSWEIVMIGEGRTTGTE